MKCEDVVDLEVVGGGWGDGLGGRRKKDLWGMCGGAEQFINLKLHIDLGPYMCIFEERLRYNI